MYARWALLAALAMVASACSDTVTEPDVPVAEAPVETPVSGLSAYEITIRYLGAPSERQQLAVSRAVEKWQSVITGDLPSVPVKVDAGACFRNQPAVNETIDDILIFVDFSYVDGAGGILGEAGPCFVRSESGLPVLGFLRLDNSDLRQMEAIGTIDDVVLHEIGHVLGIGTLWSSRALLSGAGTTDPLFTGRYATSAYRAIGGGHPGVPVENTGGEGTRDGHWRKSVFGDELMTGWISAAGNPISRVTVESLQDLGYMANTGGAETFVLGGLVQRSEASTDLRGRERVFRPQFKVDRRGRHHRHPFPRASDPAE